MKNEIRLCKNLRNRKNLVSKLLMILLIFTLVAPFTIVSTTVFANGLDEIAEKIDRGGEQFWTFLKNMGSAILLVALAIAFVRILVLADDPQAVRSAKRTFIVLAVGFLLLQNASYVVAWIKDIAGGNNTPSKPAPNQPTLPDNATLSFRYFFYYAL